MATIQQRDNSSLPLIKEPPLPGQCLSITRVVVDFVQRPFQQIYPHPGWVEHNPQDILFSQIGALTELITKHGLDAQSIDSIGIDNQRETTLVWDPQPALPFAMLSCGSVAELPNL